MAKETDQAKQGGDILGLGGAVVNRHVTPPAGSANADEEAARRRRRMNDGADGLVEAGTDLHQTPGATSVDMGAGGEGTDIE